MARADSEGTDAGSSRRIRAQSRSRRLERRGGAARNDLERRIRTSLQESAEGAGPHTKERPGPGNRAQERVRDLL